LSTKQEKGEAWEVGAIDGRDGEGSEAVVKLEKRGDLMSIAC